MCGAHAERVRAGVSLDAPIRVRPAFEEMYEERPNGCWEWIGSVDQGNGYGRFGGKWAHRVSYTRHIGEIPAGLHVDHLCRNIICVNPVHLEAVTPRVNTLRGMSPIAIAVRTNKCKRGHEFTPENTYVWRGLRFCRACQRIRKGRAVA